MPADHELLTFLKGCEPPTQFCDVLTHRTFCCSLFLGVKHGKSYLGHHSNWSIGGGLITIFGFRKTDQKLVAFGRIDRALKQDWMRTGNIDFHTSALESSSPQPLRLLVQPYPNSPTTASDKHTCPTVVNQRQLCFQNLIADRALLIQTGPQPSVPRIGFSHRVTCTKRECKTWASYPVCHRTLIRETAPR
jgi:hypothetical protein